MAQTEIEEIVNVIKSENALHNEMYNNTLSDINTKLEDIANDGITTDLIKSSLKDLEIVLESRHRFISEKFSELRESFENLNENSELLTKNADLKIMFNLLNEHIDHFAQEINDQRNLTLEIEAKLVEFRNDNSKKEEIIENISVVKDGVENINRGLEASIMDINSNLRGITKTLMTMDVTDQNDIIKRELENIYLATNAILSTMEIFDQKNDEIAKNQITKDDILSLAGKIDNSFALVSEKVDALDKSDNTNKIIAEIEKNRNELLSFNENVSKGLSDYLTSVRDVLANSIEEIKAAHAQNPDSDAYIPMQKLENLEKLSDDIKKIDTTISSQSENYLTVINTKIKELGETLDGFKSEITSSNLQAAADFTSKFQELSNKISDFPQIFDGKLIELQQKVDNGLISIENFAQENNLKFGNSLSEITGIRNDITDILANIGNLGANQDLFTAHIDGKFNENLTELKDNLSLFEGGFEKLKHDIEQSNFDNRSILSEIAEKTSVQINELLKNLHAGQNSDILTAEFKSGFENISENIMNLRNIFTEISAQNVGNILSAISDSKGSINDIEERLSGILSDGLNNSRSIIVSAIEENKQLIEDLNNHFMAISEQNAGNILSGIETASAKIDAVNENISSTFGGTFDNIQQTVSDIKDETKQQLDSLNEHFTTISEQNAGNILSGIETASAKIDAVNENISSTFGGTFENIQQTVSDIKDETKQQFDSLNEHFTTISEQNAGNILSGIETASAKIDAVNENISSTFGGTFENIQQTVSDIKDETKQQLDSLNEHFTTLSEQNAGNILSGIHSNALKIDMLGVDLSTELDNSFEMVRNYIKQTEDSQKENSQQFETLSASLTKLENEFSQNSEKFKTAIEEQINSLSNYITVLQETAEKTSDSDKFDALTEKMLSVETALHDASDTFSDNLMMVQNKVLDYENSVNYLSEQTAKKLDSTLEEISAIKDEFTKAAEKISNSGEEVSGITTSLIEKFQEITTADKDENQIQNTLTIMESQLEKLQELLTQNNLDNFDNVDNKISDLRQEISLVKTDISEIITSKTDAVAGEFAPLKEALDNFVNTGFDNILENIKSQIELSYLNFSSDVNESLTENHDNYLQLNDAYKELIEKFTKVEEIINDLNENRIGVMTSTINTVESNITNNFAKTNELLENWKNDLKNLETRTNTGFKNTEHVLDGILRHLSVLAKNSSDVSLKDLKEQFMSKFDYFDSEVTSKLKVINDELDNGGQNTTTALNNLKNLLEEINSNQNSLDKNLNALHEKVDVIALSDSSERIEDLMQSLHEKVDILASSGETEKVEEMLSTLHEKIDLLVTTDGSDDKLEEIEEVLQTLNDKIDVFTLTDNEERIEVLVKSLHDKVDILALSDDNEIINEIQNIKELAKSLHDKVDVLALSDDNEIINEIHDIKELVFEQRKQFEKSGLSERAQNIDKCLEKLLSDLSNVEERITGLDLEKNASDIKDSVMNAILAVADQITFAEETEEIKGFVEERTDEINKNLLEVKKQLNNIASSSDSWDYTYTMQDIESDIAKLRLILNDISASSSKEDISEISQNMHKIAASVNSLHSSLTEEQILDLKSNIEKINEDVLSLSSRTNKLLLTSDESYRALTDGLDEFSKISNQLQKRIDILDNSSINEVIEQKLDTITESVATSANANEVIRQVMMYLGEWIDDASEKLNSITADTSNLSVINSEICLLKSMIDNTEIIDSLEKKFNAQQERIEMLEQKLDAVFGTLQHSAAQSATFEDTFINMINEKTNKIDSKIEILEKIDGTIDKLDEKMKKLDDKLTKLSKGIEKLASYVDED